MLLHSRFLFALLTCFFLLAGCQSPSTEFATPQADYAYFPLETGRYIIYDVQEQYYTLNTAPIQRNYQLKEVVSTAYTDITGQPAYRLMRYRRSAENQLWQADSVWAGRLVNNEAIRTENGKDFVRLKFPISDKLSWNGNQYNGLEEDKYIARNVGTPFRVLGKQFDDTVTVIAQDDSTLVSQDKRIDVYARGVGLVYKERTHLQFCTTTPACIGQQQIDYGTQQVYRLRRYGTE